MRRMFLGLLVLSVLLLFFSASVWAKMYYEDECIVFVKADKVVYFSIVDEKIVGGYVIKIDMSRVVGIKEGVLHSYYDGETGENKTEVQTVIVIRDIDPELGEIIRVMVFGKSKMINIPIYFISSTEDTENL